MQRAFRWAATAMLSATIAGAEISETDLTLRTGQQAFVGTLVTPSGPPAPVVLLLHGFTGTRDELATDHVKDGVFAYTARALADAGFASLRIDFRGSGESLADLTFADTTFEGQIADAIAAVDYLKLTDAVDGDDIHIVGWSLGGLVAASVAGRVDGLDTVSLWNAVGDPEATFVGLFGSDLMQTGLDAAPDTVISTELPWGAKIELKGTFFDGIEAINPVEEIKGFDGALFVAVGAQDTTVLPENGARFIEAHEGPEKLWVAEMDHVFNVFSTETMLAELVAETIAFIEANDDSR